jgi:hypothetical protein
MEDDFDDYDIDVYSLYEMMTDGTGIIDVAFCLVCGCDPVYG